MSIQQMIEDDKGNGADLVDDNDSPTEIEIPDEDLSTSESNADEIAAAKAAEQAALDKKKQNRVPAEKRIGQITRKLRETEEYAQGIVQELQRERERTAKAERDKAISDRAAFVHYADKVEANLEKAEREYSEAMASGDTDRITKANREVSKWSAEKNEVDRYKSRMPKDEPAPREDRQPEARAEPEQRQQPKLPPEVERWTRETPWFNPDSDAFNQEMHIEAVTFAKMLENRYRRTGRAEEIGLSPEYFKEIEDHVRAEFPDEFEDVVDIAQKPAARTPPMNGGRPDTAPAARQNGIASGSPGMRVTLSAEEKAEARRFMDSGLIVDPKTKQKVKDFGRALQIWGALKIQAENDERRRSAAN